MTNISKPIVFFGTEDFSLTTLVGLIEAGFNIAAVVTKADNKKGRGQHITAPSVKILAERHNIPVWQPNKLTEITSNVKELEQPVGVLVSYGKIIPQSTIDLFTPGIINVHPSLLPRYRGPTPIESAILNGDTTTGVSIMQLARQMDAGPVYTARQHELLGTETRPELYHALADVGANLLIETLPQILDGSLQALAQNEAEATYCQLLQKNDANLDLSQLTGVQAERRIRAHIGFPKSKVIVNHHSIIITKAHISKQQKTSLDLLCQDGTFLSIDELIAPSGRPMNSDSFLRGYKV